MSVFFLFDLVIVSLVQEDEEGEEDEGYSSVNRSQSKSSRRARWESF